MCSTIFIDIFNAIKYYDVEKSRTSCSDVEYIFEVIYMEWIMPCFWLVLAVVLGIVEVCTAQFVSIWFVIAAVITAIFSAFFLADNILWQVVIFVFASALCLALTRPLVRKLKRFDKAKTNSDRHIGSVGKVIIDINRFESTGQVEVDGAKWSAKAADDIIIKAGTTVVVEDIQGVKLVVMPVDIKEGVN